MDLKKIIIVLVILFIIIVGAYFMISSQPKTISYDDHFKISVPANFSMDESNGNITSTYPKNKSYVLMLGEENGTNASSISSEYDLIKGADNVEALKDSFRDIKNYTMGETKVYEYTVSEPKFFSELGFDAKIARILFVTVPDSQKVYTLYFLSNDTSVNLHDNDIESIINSTYQNKTN